MNIIQSESSSIAIEHIETPETPQVLLRIEEVDPDEVDNNAEQEVRQDIGTANRISIISDTDYNASAESNNSSRRSSIDVPHFELCSRNLVREHRRADNREHDGQSEVGRLSTKLLLLLLLLFLH